MTNDNICVITCPSFEHVSQMLHVYQHVPIEPPLYLNIHHKKWSVWVGMVENPPFIVVYLRKARMCNFQGSSHLNVISTNFQTTPDKSLQTSIIINQ